MTEPINSLLLLPTALECHAIFGRKPSTDAPMPQEILPPSFKVALCGFGLAGSGVTTAHLIARFRPRRIFLAGLCGTYDPSILGLATVALVSDVSSDGIGAGYGAEHVRAFDMGFAESPEWPDATIPLDRPVAGPLPGHPAISVAAISPTPSAAAAVRSRRPAALIEDMESFSVALAARSFAVPLTVVRAVSNVAGHRDKKEWRIKDAFDALRSALLTLAAEVDE
jgi:futalosine hydrolase